MKLKGQRRGESGGNYIDMETGESFWVSGVKKNGEDRHWAGSGKVLVEAAALSDYLKVIGAKALDRSRCEVTDAIRQTDIKKFSQLANSSGKGSPDDPEEARNPYSSVLIRSQCLFLAEVSLRGRCQLVKNLSALSTSAPARNSRGEGKSITPGHLR